MTSVGSQQTNSKISLIQKLAMPYYAPCIQIIIVMSLLYKYQQPAYTLVAVLCIPMLGKLMPWDNYAVTHSKQHNRNFLQVLPLIVDVLFVWGVIFWTFTNYKFIKQMQMSSTIQLILTLIFLIGSSIDASHQLIHRPQSVCKTLGFLNMAVFQFTVYPIQHLYLHHKYVGSAKDPITSPKGQNVYVYTIKAFFSAHKFVFNYNIKYFAVCMATNWSYLLLLFAGSLKQYGQIIPSLAKVGFFLSIGIGGFIFLELVEYIEHYGLIYRDDIDKKVINQISSWNCQENMLNNWLIFRFQRHSDHHMNAYKIYTTLELTPKMPRFPFSFLQGAFLSLIPPLWFYIFDPYVDEIMQSKPVQKSHRKITWMVKQGLPLLAAINAIYLAYNV